MKVMRKIIHIDEELCDGCGLCVPGCAEGAIEIQEGKARLVSESYCDGLGACMGKCPKGAITVVEREAEDFDPEAVESYLKERPEKPAGDTPVCGGPGTQVQAFFPDAAEESTLSHWPVQIHLVPATAPFLKGADLLVAADCTPVAYANFHQHFLKDRVVMIGCPKFDDVEAYTDKFTEIFRANPIKSITCLIMQVPCCSSLPTIIRRALKAAGKDIPLEEIVISPKGEILARAKEAAQ